MHVASLHIVVRWELLEKDHFVVGAFSRIYMVWVGIFTEVLKHSNVPEGDDGSDAILVA